MRFIASLVAALAMTAVLPVASPASAAHAHRLVVAATDTGARAEGEIRKVDPATRKITIRHGELKALDMPPMTMVFQVRDPAMLEQVKPGDKVVFRVEKINGAFTVMEIEVVR